MVPASHWRTGTIVVERHKAVVWPRQLVANKRWGLAFARADLLHTPLGGACKPTDWFGYSLPSMEGVVTFWRHGLKLCQGQEFQDRPAEMASSSSLESS